MNLLRRRFLQMAGLGAGSLLLPSLRSPKQGGTVAHAAPGDPPIRMIICMAEHGVVHERWGMRGSRPADQRWNYDLAALTEAEFSDTMKPLYRHRNKLSIIDGLSTAVGIADPYGDDHAKGWCAALTGAIARETIEGVKSNAAKLSIDQVLGKELRAANPLLTDLVTQEFGVYQYNFHALIYGDGQQGGPVVRLPHLEQPLGAYERLFPNGDGTVPPDPIKVAQPDILASVAPMYDQIAGRLSMDDRRKLEQHRDLVRDMEARLRHLSSLTCSAPQIDDYYWGEVGHPERFVAHTQSFFDLATAAMRCDVSRIVTMQWGQLHVEMIGGTGDLHGDYAHVSDPNQSEQPGHADAKDKMTRYSQVYNEYIAELADLLDSIPEANGTMLDNTMIVYLSDISHGGHAHDRWPVWVVGGGNVLNTGKYYNFEKATPTTALADWIDPNGLIGMPHNHFLVTLARAMGTDLNVIGDATVRPKKAGLPAIDLSGPLPGLLR